MRDHRKNYQIKQAESYSLFHTRKSKIRLRLEKRKEKPIMTFDKFTIKAQEAVQEAVNTAQQAGNQAIEPIHLLQGVLAKGKDIVGYIFQKLGINTAQMETLVQEEIAHLPKVQGG